MTKKKRISFVVLLIWVFLHDKSLFFLQTIEQSKLIIMITEEYQLIYTSPISNGKVYLHPQHSKKEISENSEIGKRLADHNKVVVLPIHVNTKSV